IVTRSSWVSRRLEAPGRTARLTVVAAAERCLNVSHALDQSSNPIIGGPERILTQHRTLRLVIEFQVHPVDREVPTAFLGAFDEVAPQLGTSGLWWHRLGFEDVQIACDPIDVAAPLHEVIQATVAVNV